MSLNPEVGQKFTEERYLSHAELENAYNTSEVDDLWSRILAYRRPLSVEMEIRDPERNPYSLTLTRALTRKAYVLEIRLLSLLRKVEKRGPSFESSFFLEAKTEALKALLRYDSVTEASDATIAKIASGEMESIPATLFGISAYSKALNALGKEGGMSLVRVYGFNHDVLGDERDAPVRFRKTAPSDLLNPLLAPAPEEIPDHLENLLGFLSQEEVPALVKAILVSFFFDSVRPFEYANEETGALLSKAYLKETPLEDAGLLLDFESLSFSRSRSFFETALKAQKTLDLTYYVLMALPFFEGQVDQLEKKVQQAPCEPKATPNPASLALPYFPSEPAKDEEALTKKLMEVYPALKPKEAHFYVTHCTVGLFYTIAQFQSAEKTVYETARTSMEDLASRGFYRKTKLKKKFVYTPIPQQESPKEPTPLPVVKKGS